MNTIRPLATIAILAGLGIFLAHQINQPTSTNTEQLTANWGEAPPFEAEGGSTAPAYAPEPLAPPLSAPVSAPPATPPAMSIPGGPQGAGLPPLPALPSVSAPPLVAPAVPSQQVTPPAMPTIPLPEKVPAANFDGMPAIPIEREPLVDLAPPARTPPPAPQSPLPTTDPYRSYSPAAEPPVAPAAEPSYPPLGQAPGVQQPTFREALPSINHALVRGELTRAHALLSSWYGDPGLTAPEREQVNKLLSQLAGTVVYSTEHRLEPPYTVRQGETLKSIAKSYNVPWRLLAKINGVPNADAIQPGQTLKVIRGPFNAVVDSANGELVLMIDGKYAGKFPVQLTGAAQQAGSWSVQDKPTGDAASSGPTTDKQLVLKDPSGMGTVVIGSGGGSPVERGRVSVASTDLNELYDILSVGSSVTIMK